MTRLPILFKKTSTGAIQQWQISVEGTTIVTVYGQVGGKLQTTKDLIKMGKNQGKKNETDPKMQAKKEAESQWTKKKKAGYVENLKDAESGKTDSIIEGGVVPMLAKVFEEHESKVKFPVAVQPKLDGHRCIAIVNKDGSVSLWTRTRKRITSVPHIEERLSKIIKSGKLPIKSAILDGELYTHKYKDDFEKITSAARKKEATKESEEIQYHIYDIVSDSCFRERLSLISDIELMGGNEVSIVQTIFVETYEQMLGAYRIFIDGGYEGMMIRLLGMGYQNKRTHQLLKVKEFYDGEFKIIGMEEGRGKLSGHIGSFICKTKEGKEFKAKMSGDTKKLKELFDGTDWYIGEYLTVQFQGKTADGIPRFPVGIRIREDL